MSEQGTGDILLRLTIPGNPTPKKNNMRILHTPDGRPFVAPSRRFSDFQKQCAQYIPDSARVSISQPCNIECLYFRSDHRRVDLTNLQQSSDDILVHYGVIADCQRRYEIVRKRRRNFVVFRRQGGDKIKRFLAQKECSQFAASGA